MDLDTPISELSRVGKATAKRLEKINVRNVRDLLLYFPFRYEDYRKIYRIKDLKDGELVTVLGQVELLRNKRSFKKRKIITEAVVSDATGSIRVVWFNQPFLIKNIQAGDIVYLSGKAHADMLGLQLVSPIYEKYRKENVHTARLVPIYPLTEGMTQKQLRFLISQAISLVEGIKEWVPDKIIKENNFIDLSKAIKLIHYPANEQELKKARERLEFDELFELGLKAQVARASREQQRAPIISFREWEIKNFVSKLPFQLTTAQKVAAWEIFKDTAKAVPMNRLVSGDVGSGKTVVSAMGIYNAVLNGFQTAMMAPTEILAIQHFNSLVKLYEGLNLRIALLTGSKSQIANSKVVKKKLMEEINLGNVDTIVGTHALLTDEIRFKKIGLVVVDEQHRFGVEQRKIMREKGRHTHFLSMTATPIPRSLALVLYGDLDISVINELPPGRKKVLTKIVQPENRDKAYQFIRGQIKNGRQIFVICPLIEIKGEGGAPEIKVVNDKKTVLSEYEKLSKEVFPDLRVVYLHGKMKSRDKEQVMEDLKNKKGDILISTSVIEVGVDIPNASVMLIEGADSFGLAQLHQFRGRVGRSVHQSYCLLFTNRFGGPSLERLRYFETISDGFQLAEKDLNMRGPGDLYGTEQSGVLSNLRLARLDDKELIKKVRESVVSVLEDIKKYPELLSKVEALKGSFHLE